MSAPATFDYAILRVVPRVDREEFINAGVVVFCLEKRYLEASILLSGFFGSPGDVIGQWIRTGAVHAAHVAGLWRNGHCTCHG